MSNAADTAISFARAQIGKPYQWGATGPDSYDCSGLVQAAYKSAGIQLSRTTYGQVADGSKVAQSDLAPGDLVFPDAGHVQIYTGNGKVVEAPSTGLNVREVPMWGYWTAVRVTTPGTNASIASSWTELTASERAIVNAYVVNPSKNPAPSSATLAKLTAPHRVALAGAITAATGQKGTGSVLDQLGNAGSDALGIPNPVAWAEGLAKVLAWISHPNHWIRIGEVLAGVLLIVIALSKVTNLQLPQFASKAAGMAAFA